MNKIPIARSVITAESEKQKWIEAARTSFQDSIAVKENIISQHLDVLFEISQNIVMAISQGRKLLLCGNGGSAADAQHLTAEFLVRLRSQVDRQSLPAICLATDISTLTACGNDYGFEEVFARTLSGLGCEGDLLLGITTSGKSPNIIRAFHQAKEMGIKTIGFLGCDGGAAAKHCDLSFIVPSHTTARIQEAHITAGHVIMELVEDMLAESGFLRKVSK